MSAASGGEIAPVMRGMAGPEVKNFVLRGDNRAVARRSDSL